MEEWKEVDGFPGYEVSSLGRVRIKRLKIDKGFRTLAEAIIYRDLQLIA